MKIIYECLKCHYVWGPGENLPTTCPECEATGEAACEHGTALDVHCCNCHSGFLFDSARCVCSLTLPMPSPPVADRMTKDEG